MEMHWKGPLRLFYTRFKQLCRKHLGQKLEVGIARTPFCDTLSTALTYVAIYCVFFNRKLHPQSSTLSSVFSNKMKQTSFLKFNCRLIALQSDSVLWDQASSYMQYVSAKIAITSDKLLKIMFIAVCIDRNQEVVLSS